MTLAPRLLAVLLVASPLAALPAPPAAQAAATSTVTVSGTGVSTYPAYATGIRRFAILTTPDAGGTVTVTATPRDPAGVVHVNGHPVRAGQPYDVTGLQPGDEVNVTMLGQGGNTNQSWIYLPAGFPELHTTWSAGQAPGLVFLDIRNAVSPDRYEAVVDRRGVPVYASAAGGADLKVSDANPAHYSVARPAQGGGYVVQELDQRFRVVASHQLDPQASSTDYRDSQLLADGRTLLMGYHSADRGGQHYVDALIQVVDTAGRSTFRWNSKDHVDPAESYVTAEAGGDYAHLDSMQMQPNGDVVASFRNLSQVMRIATWAHGPYRPGDVVWRLGGREGDFRFVHDPYGGPCAQHSVRVLPDGHLLVFDNGSERDTADPDPAQTADMCPGPGGDADHPVARPQTRIAEYALDVSTHRARLVWSHQVDHRYAASAGSAQRLGNGNTFIGWSHAYDNRDVATDPAHEPMATEVTPDQQVVFTLTTDGAWSSYRDFKFAAPDRIRPAVQVAGLADGDEVAAGSDVVADYGCTDRGGSNLASCTGTVPSGSDLDTRPGKHTLRVVATDGAGNKRVRTLQYTAA